MIGPFLLVLGAEVACEGLLAPGAIGGIGDGRECGDGFVFAGIFEELGE